MISINFEPFIITKDPYITDDGIKCNVKPLAGFNSNGKPLTEDEVHQIKELNNIFYKSRILWIP